MSINFAKTWLNNRLRRLLLTPLGGAMGDRRHGADLYNQYIREWKRKLPKLYENGRLAAHDNCQMEPETAGPDGI
ncbi:unnamed protein product [Pieris brassicae]|uniref:Uncharacterized protein n=1 Tax=Pieris brassicae TaxID=7116 RepID=A0A9P0T2S3_PIEBR|nr:unnamed protein product [Pieris brassicae]